MTQKTYAFRLSAEGVEDLRRRLASLGKDGEAAFDRLAAGAKPRLTDAMKAAANDAGRLGDQLRRVQAQGSPAMRVLGTAADSARDAMGGLAAELGSVGLVLSRLGAGGLVAGAVVGGLAAVSRAGMAYADSLATVSAQTGVGVEDLQRLRYALRQVDIEAGTTDAILARLGKSIGDAAAGGKAQADAFAALGISVRDSSGAIRDTTDVLPELLEGLRNTASAGQQLAIAGKLVGDSLGQQLAGAAALGADGLAELTARAERLGLVLGEDTVERVAELSDRFEDLTYTLGVGLRNAAVIAADAINDIFTQSIDEELNKLTTTIISTQQELKRISSPNYYAEGGVMAPSVRQQQIEQYERTINSLMERRKSLIGDINAEVAADRQRDELRRASAAAEASAARTPADNSAAERAAAAEKARADSARESIEGQLRALEQEIALLEAASDARALLTEQQRAENAARQGGIAITAEQSDRLAELVERREALLAQQKAQEQAERDRLAAEKEAAAAEQRRADAARQATDAIEQQIVALERRNALLRLRPEDRAAAEQVMQAEDAAAGGGIALGDEQRARIEREIAENQRLERENAANERYVAAWTEAADDLVDGLGRAAKDFLLGGENLGEDLKSLGRELSDSILEAAIKMAASQISGGAADSLGSLLVNGLVNGVTSAATAGLTPRMSIPTPGQTGPVPPPNLTVGGPPAAGTPAFGGFSSPAAAPVNVTFVDSRPATDSFRPSRAQQAAAARRFFG